MWRLSVIPLLAISIALLFWGGAFAFLFLVIAVGVRIWADRRFQAKILALTDEAQTLADDLGQIDQTRRGRVRQLDDDIGHLCQERSIWQWLFATSLILAFSGFSLFARVFGTVAGAVVVAVVGLLAAARMAVVTWRIRKAERVLKALGVRSRHRFRYPI